MRWFHWAMKSLRRYKSLPLQDIDVAGEIQKSELRIEQIKAARIDAESRTPEIERQTLFLEDGGRRNHFGESMYVGWQSRYGSGNV